MSQDARVTKDLIETLKDGQEGFASAADRLAESTWSELAPEFREYADQRARFASELETLAARYGDDIDASGSLAAATHRFWMAVKDTFSGDDPDGVLDAAEQGEDHSVSEYEKALEADISPELRTVVQRQLSEIQAAHNRVRALRNAA